MKAVFATGFLSLAVSLLAHVATGKSRRRPIGFISSLEGQAQILSDPKEELDDSESRALHENLYWKSRHAKLNSALYLSDYLICFKGCRLKASFRNSYTLILGPGSKVRLGRSFLKRNVQEPGFIDLVFGSLRAIIRKNADRKHKVPRFRTKSAVMGVRGTDFVITSDQLKTVVSVITGEIGLKSAIPALLQVEETVGAGMTSKVVHPPAHLLEKIRLNEKVSQADLNHFLPGKPEKISRRELKSIKEISGKAVDTDHNLRRIEKRILAEETKTKAPAPKPVGKQVKESSLPLALPQVFFGFMLQHRGGEIETGERLERWESFSGHAWEGRVEIFPFSIPVSLGLHVAKVTFEEGLDHFSPADFQVHQLSGWEAGNSVGFWIPFSSLYISLKLRIVAISKIRATGTHLEATEGSSSHEEDRYYSIPGFSLRAAVIYPFTSLWHAFGEFSVGEQGFTGKDDQRSTLPKFHGPQLSLGIYYQPGIIF